MPLGNSAVTGSPSQKLCILGRLSEFPPEISSEDRVASLIFERGLAQIRIHFVSALIKILRAHMQRLVDIADIMGQQNDRDGLRDLARILFRDLPSENRDAVRTSCGRCPIGCVPFCRWSTWPLPPAHRCNETNDAKASANCVSCVG